jgi:hypothetical protein
MPASSKANGSALAILCIGEDEQLLETRALLLRSTGAEVWCSTSGQILKFVEQKTFGQKVFDLIVLCHTVKKDVAFQITESAHHNLPPSRVLQLEPISAESKDRTGVAFDAVVVVEPASLLRAATQLLSQCA